jgi:FkbM family methyltransferase
MKIGQGRTSTRKQREQDLISWRFVFRFLFISCFVIFWQREFFKFVSLFKIGSQIVLTEDNSPINNVPVVSAEKGSSSKQQLVQKQQRSPQQCTRDELLKVRNQINPEACPSALTEPWSQLCGITLRTKCVDASNWLDEYYAEIYYYSDDDDGNGGNRRQQQQQPFLGISVGCNKGFDALNTLRMGIFDASLDKKSWQIAMVEANDGEPFHNAVCGQNNVTEQFQLPPPVPKSNSNSNKKKNDGIDATARIGEMHCFEPMPQTVGNLQRSVKRLGYDRLGFHVVPNAVSNKPGTVVFFTGNKAGIENIGIDNACMSNTRMDPASREKVCKDVEVVTLKDYVETNIDKSSKSNNEANAIIHHLSIDVEGYDVDVLFGAGPSVLKRVEYLEFEYNWMGSWKKQHLYDVIRMLDGKKHRPIYNSNENNDNADEYSELSFTCYWAGKQRLWRITDCWMRFYDIHTWGNVACVNRKLAPMLAAKMEHVFLNTLKHTDSDGNNGHDERYSKWADHPMLQTEPHDSMVSTEYL